MVITPLLRGMLGIKITDGGNTVKLAPQIPINWDDLEIRRISAGNVLLDFTLRRENGKLTISIARRSINSSDTKSSTHLILAPAFPFDAKVKSVSIDGQPTTFNLKRIGDIQQAEMSFDLAQPKAIVSFVYDEGTDVYLIPQTLVAGAETSGLRIIKSQAGEKGLFLSVEGAGQQTYQLNVRSTHQLQEVEGVKVKSALSGGDAQLSISFQGAPQTYIKREILIPYQN
ncbi:MAG: hypothetical protein ABI954_15705 [Pyrinomonadaceae bacterium]